MDISCFKCGGCCQIMVTLSEALSGDGVTRHQLCRCLECDECYYYLDKTEPVSESKYRGLSEGYLLPDDIFYEALERMRSCGNPDDKNCPCSAHPLQINVSGATTLFSEKWEKEREKEKPETEKEQENLPE